MAECIPRRPTGGFGVESGAGCSVGSEIGGFVSFMGGFVDGEPPGAGWRLFFGGRERLLANKYWTKGINIPESPPPAAESVTAEARAGVMCWIIVLVTANLYGGGCPDVDEAAISAWSVLF